NSRTSVSPHKPCMKLFHLKILNKYKGTLRLVLHKHQRQRTLTHHNIKEIAVPEPQRMHKSDREVCPNALQRIITPFSATMYLSRLTSLQHLSLRNVASINDASLEYLAPLCNLEVSVCFYTNKSPSISTY